MAENTQMAALAPVTTAGVDWEGLGPAPASLQGMGMLEKAALLPDSASQGL